MDQQKTSQLSPCLKLWLLLASSRAGIKMILLKSIPLPTPSKWQFNETVSSDLEVVIQKLDYFYLPQCNTAIHN